MSFSEELAAGGLSQAQTVAFEPTTLTVDPNKSNFVRPESAPQSAADPHDYERLPDDLYGDEMGPNAKVWRMYLEEARRVDNEMVEGWKDTTDVLLVFAGLFSAVVTTLVVQTSQSLRPDRGAIALSLLSELVLLQRAALNGSSETEGPLTALNQTDPPPASSLWVNGLWFTSLALSLSTALIAVLIKQWIHRYTIAISGAPRCQMRTRHYRYEGILRWKVPEIVGVLPFLLHLALLLFFAGLTAFLWDLNAVITATVGSISLSAYIFYFAANLAPIYFPQCPYQTPVSDCIRALLSSIVSGMHIAIAVIGMIVLSTNNKTCNQSNIIKQAIIHEKEEIDNMRRGHEFDAKSIVWLMTSCSNPSIRSVAIQSISGIRPNFQWPQELEEYAFRRISTDLDLFNAPTMSLSKAERLYRALTVLSHPLPDSVSQRVDQMGQSHDIYSGSTDSKKTKHRIYTMMKAMSSDTPVDVLLEAQKNNVELTPMVWIKLIQRLPQIHWKLFFSLFPLQWTRQNSACHNEEQSCTLTNPTLDVKEFIFKRMHDEACFEHDCSWLKLQSMDDRCIHLLMCLFRLYTTDYRHRNSKDAYETCLNQFRHYADHNLEEVYKVQAQWQTVGFMKSILDTLDVMGSNDFNNDSTNIMIHLLSKLICTGRISSGNTVDSENHVNIYTMSGPCYTKNIIRYYLRYLNGIESGAEELVFISMSRMLIWDPINSIQALDFWFGRTKCVTEGRSLRIREIIIDFVRNFLSAAQSVHTVPRRDYSSSLFDSKTMRWIILNCLLSEGCGMSPHEAGSLFTELVRIRPDSEFWHGQLEWLLSEIRSNAGLYLCQNPNPTTDFRNYLSGHHLQRIIEGIKTVAQISDPGLVLYKYVSGRDIGKSSLHWATIDGNLVYAPYVVPYEVKRYESQSPVQ